MEGRIDKEEVGLYLSESKIFLDCGTDCNYNIGNIILMTSKEMNRIFHLYWAFNEKSIIYVPFGTEELFKEYLNSIHSLNNCKKKEFENKIVGVKEGDIIEYKNYKIKIVETDKEQIGYLFFEKRKKLKEEYKSLGKEEIKKMKDVSIEIEYPLFGYFGIWNHEKEFKEFKIIDERLF